MFALRTWDTFLRLEARLLLRSLRGRTAVGIYLALTSAPAVIAARAQRGPLRLGGSTYAADVLSLLPLASALLAVVLGLDGIVRERRSGAWSVLTLGPLSSAGYLLRRLAAQVAILVPLSLAPLLVAAVAARLAGAPAAPLVNWLWPWLILVVPVVLGASAAALAAGMIGDGLVPGAIVLATVATLLPGAVNGTLGHVRRQASLAVGPWLGTAAARSRITHYAYSLPKYRLDGFRAVIPATEAPLPAGPYAAAVASAGALPFCCCLALFGVSAAYFRRTTRDLSPWRPRPGHGLAARLRPRLLPDVRLERGDRRLLAAAALSVIAGGAFWEWRDHHYQAVLVSMHALQLSGWPPPTPPDVAAIAARLDGRVSGDGTVEMRGEIALRNRGAAPVGHFAFTLNDGLALADLRSDRGAARVTRRLDRVGIELDPPLAAGAEVRFSARTVGAPTRLRLALAGGESEPFERRFRLHTHSLAADLPDLGRSLTLPLADRERLELGWSDAFLLPRTASFALARGEALEGGGFDVLPEERSPTLTALTVDLTAPPAVRLADACGASGSGSVHAACTMALRDWRVAGGHLLPVPEPALSFAALPQHVALATTYADELAALPTLVRNAWPGAESQPQPALLEDPPAWSLDPRDGVADWSTYGARDDEARSASRLLFVPERWLVREDRLPVADLVAGSVASDLLNRRGLATADAPVIQGLVRALVLGRLGRAPHEGATISCRRMDLAYYRISLLDVESQSYQSWKRRVLALAQELQTRAGSGPVQRGLARFFAATPEIPGTLAELIRTIGETAAVDLAEFYRDDLAGTGLPELTLAEARSAALPRGFRVTGRVVNQGTGTAYCPVVVTTETGTFETRVAVAAGASASFALETANPPQSVLLDPDSTCFRWASEPPGLLRERVDFDAGAR